MNSAENILPQLLGPIPRDTKTALLLGLGYPVIGLSSCSSSNWFKISHSWLLPSASNHWHPFQLLPDPASASAPCFNGPAMQPLPPNGHRAIQLYPQSLTMQLPQQNFKSFTLRTTFKGISHFRHYLITYFIFPQTCIHPQPLHPESTYQF